MEVSPTTRPSLAAANDPGTTVYQQINSTTVLTIDNVLYLPINPSDFTENSFIYAKSADSSLLAAANGNTPSVSLLSEAVDISLASGEISGSLEICLNTNSKSDKDACLGYIDEKTNEWKCEDYCLKSRNGSYSCGKTSHLTNFAILLQGGSGSKNKCGSEEDYITDTAYHDLILVIAIIVFVIIVAVIISIICINCPIFHSFLYGEEGARIKTLRTRRRTNTGTPLNEDNSILLEQS